MKKFFALALFVMFAAAGAAHAQAPRAAPAPRAAQADGPAIEILWYGVIDREQDSDEDADKPEQSDKVAARQGVEFGVAYTVTGVPEGAKITLHQIARYPTPGRRNTSTGQLQKTEEADTECQAGQPCLTSYVVEAPDEVIPGIWSLELQYQGKTIMERRFLMRYEGI